MFKLMILAYDFPPYVSVGGLRPYSWFKYLRLFNIYPIVVTRQWGEQKGNSFDYISPGYSNSVQTEETENGIILKVPFKPNLANKILLKYGENKYRLLRKFISLFYLLTQYILPVGNMKEIHRAADEYMRDNKIDCIIASGDPFILFKYASVLSGKYSVPWIADYRDSWVQDKSMKNKFYKQWNAFIERRLLKNVSKITTVSTFIQKQIEQNISEKKFEIVLNGYDPEIIEVAKHINQNRNILSISFNGTLQLWNPIDSFLRVCNDLLKENVEVSLQLNFFGLNRESEIKEKLKIEYRNLEKFVNFYPRMNNLEYAKFIAKQNIFLLFNDYSILGTKIFDYLALKRKILFCFEDDKDSLKLRGKYFFLNEMEEESDKLQADVIKATNSGIVVKDSLHLKTVLRELNAELKTNGFVKCDSVGVGKYSRINQVERLAEIVKEVSGKK